MNVAIIEDNIHDCNYIKKITQEIFLEYDQQKIICECFSNVSLFKKSYIPKRYSLIFLDCYLDNEELGINAGLYVRSYNDNTPIIFTSSYDDFAVEGYEIKAAGYLLKPISKEKLKKLIEDLFFFKTSISIKLDNNKYISLNIDDLMCCQSDHHYVNLLMKENKTLRLRITIKYLYEQIKYFSQLYNCSRGYIVNLDYVDYIDNRSFILTNRMNIPISRQLYNEAKNIYHNFLFAKLRG